MSQTILVEHLILGKGYIYRKRKKLNGVLVRMYVKTFYRIYTNKRKFVVYINGLPICDWKSYYELEEYLNKIHPNVAIQA